MKRIIISESEKSQILGLHSKINDDVIITDWLSPDEKYVIFLDELYDIKNKKKLGNIWENFDNLKFFLQHSFNVSNLPKQLKESINSEINNLLITESTKNLLSIKEDIKEFLNEGLWSSFKSWAAETGKSSWEGFKEFGKKMYKGAGDLIDKVSKGEWKQVFSLLGKGVLYLARKLRSAMYHPIGLILDAILVATGIGKAVQWIPWAIVVALDVYELVSGNSEENLPMWQQLLFLGVDILGLVFAGAMAKGARTTVKAAVSGAKTAEDLVKVVAKNSTFKNILTKMGEGLSKAPGKLSEAATYLSTKFPKGASFIKGILGKIGTFIKKISDFISKALHTVAPGTSKLAKGTRAGVGTTALVGGIGTYGEYKKEKEEEMLAQAIMSSDIEPTYDINKL
jgi:uncharacterized protein YaaR (DUF327 family)